ncbi:MAG: metal ABC transporter substrate-binding protein [Candidatus Eisenbacteria bacterium]
MIRRIVLAALLVSAFVPAAACAKLRVAASTTDLASIASSVGGEQVEVFAIARATADPHRVEALPSYMIKVAKAQLYLRVGLGLDQWSGAIVDGSRNSKIVVVDCSRGVRVLEKPAGKVDASMGDVHPEGNPHWWLDPRNGAIAARTIAEAFAAADPANAAAYRTRAEAFGRDAQAAWEKGRAQAAALPNHTLLTYHRSWPYLADAFGFEIVDTIEPVPGIPPTARHLADLQKTIAARKVPVLLQEPYFSADAGRFLQRGSALRVLTLSPACDDGTAGSYLAHVQAVLGAIAGGPGR